MTRLLLSLLLLAPALEAQAPPRVRIVVYRLQAASTAPADTMLARTVGRALVRSLIADSMFQVMDRPGASNEMTVPRPPTAQFAVIGGVAIRGAEARVNLRVVDIANVQLLVQPSVIIPDRSAPDAVTLAAAALARQIHQHFAATAR